MSRRITITPAKTTFEVRYSGVVIARSDRVQMLAEAGHDPVPYFPLDSVDHSRLSATDHRTSCPHKGRRVTGLLRSTGSHLKMLSGVMWSRWKR